MSTPALIIEEQLGVVRRLTLNRSEHRNALSMAMMAALIEALGRAAQERRCKVVVLAAAGPAFCAGHDLKELKALQETAETGLSACEAVFGLCSELMMSLVALPLPVIAQVQGVATAAGCQLVAGCDLAVAAESARFATPGVNIGLFCSTPMVALSRNIGRKPAMEMLLTGEMIGAARARELGLVNRVVADAALQAETLVFAESIAAKSPAVLRLGKEAFYRQAEMSLADAYAFTARIMAENLLLPDAAEGIGAFLEKRAPVWPPES